MTTPVRLFLPPERSYLRLARLTASALAIDLDFGTDEIDDLKIGVDELCAVLLDGATGPLELSFEVTDGSIVISGRCEGDASEPVDLHPIAQELLSMVVDEFTLRSTAGVRTFDLRRAARSPAS